jgi:phosphate transport system ATP-binding protein
MSQQAKIEIKNFNFFYGEKQAISNLNLKIMPNSITAIFGPANGGTSTLLYSLNRLCDLVYDARAEGEILLNGKDIRAADVNVAELRRKIGIVFEDTVPLPMSVFDNIAYGLRMSGIKKKGELDEKVENALRLAVLWDEVKDILQRPALRLSGGQQQRLCIARTLAIEPEVIMLDRPCSALDPISTHKIEDSLLQLKEHFTIILIPHNVQQAARVADYAGFMLMGSLIEFAPTKELFDTPKEKRTEDYITGRFG